jgi:hypothetical protein
VVFLYAVSSQTFALAWRRIRHLGEILVEQGVLTQTHVPAVLNAQGKTLGVCNV